MSVRIGFICLVLIAFSKTVCAALGDVCVDDTGCTDVANAVCDAGGTDVCVCDPAWTRGTDDDTQCFQAVDLGTTCTEADQCKLGNGGANSLCSGSSVCACDSPSYEESGSTCVRSCGQPNQAGYTLTLTATTFESDTATVACAAGYEGTPGGDITCQSGSWTTATGCTATDCGAPSQTGYSFTTTTTLEGDTATVACAAGYEGTPGGDITCQSGSWTTATGCTATDCGAPSQTGYSFTTTTTLEGDTANVACANGYSENSGTPADITCQSGSWTTATGCTATGGGGGGGGIDLGNPCNNDGECQAGGGGAHSECSTNCICSTGYADNAGSCDRDCGNPTASTGYIPQSSPASTLEDATVTVSCDTNNGYTGTATDITCQASGSWTAYSGCSSGASDGRQNYNIVILIGALVFALMLIPEQTIIF